MWLTQTVWAIVHLKENLKFPCKNIQNTNLSKSSIIKVKITGHCY